MVSAMELLARTIRRDEVAFHFFGGEAFTYDWMGELGRIRCPTLIMAGELDRDHDGRRPRGHARPNRGVASLVVCLANS